MASSRPRPRLYTVEEANALLPEVRDAIERIRSHPARVQEVRDLVEDLEAYYGEALVGATDAERERHRALKDELSRLLEEVGASLRRLAGLGCEVKDLERGLVDFYADRGGEIVCLCWERGESRIAHWHSLEGGFAGRQPLP